MKERKIYVFLGGVHPEPLGTLYVGRDRAHEVYSFAFASSFLQRQDFFLDANMHRQRHCSVCFRMPLRIVGAGF